MKNNVSNIVLLGHMGSGKSTIGKSLAKRLSIDFVDSDYEIEKHTNSKIREIFLNQGENATHCLQSSQSVFYADHHKKGLRYRQAFYYYELQK